MKPTHTKALALIVLGSFVTAPALAEEPVIGEVLQILKDRGLIDEAKHSELVAKNSSYEEEHKSLLGRIEWSGDFRARLENFWHSEDGLGSQRANRTRARYRLRLGGKARINDFTKVVFRIASGEGDHRSTNRTLGKGDDFDPDSIFIDRAYIELKAPKGWIGEGNGLKLLAGKTKNPFRWKNGKDYMLFDSDVNPEGGALLFETQPLERLRAYLTAGYYVIDENSKSEDPHFTGIQGGVDLDLSETLRLGGRASWYSFASLNPAFLERASNVGAATDDDFRVLELAGYLKVESVPDWPVLLYGHYARNVDAGRVSTSTGSDEDTGWGVGVELGDKKKFAKLGFGYYRLEANFFPAQFIDSDLFDGKTNRKGFTFYGSRQILPGTDLNITLFKGEELHGALPVYASSVKDADRIRLQTDIVVKF